MNNWLTLFGSTSLIVCKVTNGEADISCMHAEQEPSWQNFYLPRQIYRWTSIVPRDLQDVSYHLNCSVHINASLNSLVQDWLTCSRHRRNNWLRKLFLHLPINAYWHDLPGYVQELAVGTASRDNYPRMFFLLLLQKIKSMGKLLLAFIFVFVCMHDEYKAKTLYCTDMVKT